MQVVEAGSLCRISHSAKVGRVLSLESPANFNCPINVQLPYLQK